MSALATRVVAISARRRSSTLERWNGSPRLNRAISDQLCAQLPRGATNGKKVLIFCGDDEPEELGGQICSDMFESNGWTVRFAGGGVPEDEVLSLIGTERPDLLIMFGTLPSGVPAVRKLIDYLRDVNSCPQMQITLRSWLIGLWSIQAGRPHRARALAWSPRSLATHPRLPSDQLIPQLSPISRLMARLSSHRVRAWL